MKIIRYASCNDIDVEFLDEHHYIKKNSTYSNYKSGCIKNPYDKSLYGVGYIGEGKYMARINGKLEVAYRIWSGIIERCYHSEKKFPAYYGKCIVCDEWHNYQNFAKWYDENKYECNGRLHIDKDILSPNCYLYSPQTCLLVPQRINMLFVNLPNNTGLPNGINLSGSGKYMAEYNNKYLGTFDTLKAAYSMYANKKEEIIKQIADEYKEIIPQKVYDALYAYKVDIHNDKNYVA